MSQPSESATRAITSLVQLSLSNDVDVASGAVESLRRLGRTAVAILADLAADSDRLGRSAVAEVLGQVRSDAAGAILEGTAADSEWFVRRCVAEALGLARPDAAVRVIQRMADGLNEHVRPTVAAGIEAHATAMTP